MSTVFGLVLGIAATVYSAAAADAVTTATPAPVVSASPTMRVATWLTTRPRDAAMMRVAVGTFEHFSAGKSPSRMILTLRDDQTGATSQFFLSAGTTLNGLPLCGPGVNVCNALPTRVVAGKTRIAVLYWQPAGRGFYKQSCGADTLLALPLSAAYRGDSSHSALSEASSPMPKRASGALPKAPCSPLYIDSGVTI